jgi:DNA end-binding protein Ku
LIAGLWALLRELLERPAAVPGAGLDHPAPPATGRAGDGSGGGSLSKADLYRQAQELDVPGRSKMTKDELAAAVAAARGGRTR